MMSRFKGLDLVECLNIYGWRFITGGYGGFFFFFTKTIPKKKKCKKAKWLFEEILQIAEERRDVKDKGERKR